jgi:hypothetical protein
MPEPQGALTFDADFQPASLRRTDGLVWRVCAVLCGWQHPAPAPVQATMPGMVRCWRMRVRGPLPGDPAHVGEFVMTARTHGNRPGWVFRPGPPACECWLAAEPARLGRHGRA